MKTKTKFKAFSSKILLLGEHIINKGATGLAMPISLYDGQFAFEKLDESKDKSSNDSLLALAHYILSKPILEKSLDINAFLEDIENGLVFHSDIPQGFGLGSSGALVAAVFDAYAFPKTKKLDISIIKNLLGEIESCFHGKSSGLDPIVSYLNCPITIKEHITEKISLKEKDKKFLDVYLINTGIARKTNIWVNKFMEQSSESNFEYVLSNSYIPAKEICIESFINLKYDHFWKSLKIISQTQIEHLIEFIPISFHKHWRSGIQNNEFYLKICGAGGGGFVLCFAKKGIMLPDFLDQKKQLILSF